MHIYICMYVHVYMHVCMYIYDCMCTYVHVYMCVYERRSLWQCSQTLALDSLELTVGAMNDQVLIAIANDIVEPDRHPRTGTISNSTKTIHTI